MVFIIDDNNDFDKVEIVKKYFARIFNVLSKEVREKLLKLDFSEKDLEKIKKELAFLSEDKQIKYLEELTENKS
ncbi:MAG: hypothetical protein ACFFD5_12955 [Candidatus Thorarchaeota archaeon]